MLSNADLVELSCRAGYGKKWDDPVEGPGEEMKNVWRKHVAKFLEPVIPIIREQAFAESPSAGERLKEMMKDLRPD